MALTKWSTSEQIAQIVKQCLEEGKSVEIDGLGVFRSDGAQNYEFLSHSQPKVFLAYVQEDVKFVERLYDYLVVAGFDPWMDRRKLMPGQNWPRSIEDAIETSDFFVACFSDNSVSKKGGFQAEIRYALDCARNTPLDEIFVIPARLNDCRLPQRIQREIQYIDFFPDFERGFRRIVAMMQRQLRRERRIPA